MSNFQEITERYKENMRETQERHMRRVAEIQHEHFIKGVVLVVVSAFALFSPFIALLFR